MIDRNSSVRKVYFQMKSLIWYFIQNLLQLDDMPFSFIVHITHRLFQLLKALTRPLTICLRGTLTQVPCHTYLFKHMNLDVFFNDFYGSRYHSGMRLIN
jgi:hypothetical protein